MVAQLTDDQPGVDLLDLGAGASMGALAGGLSVSTSLGAVVRFGGQAVLSAGEGMLKGETSDGELVRNGAFGLVGEGLGNLLSKGANVAFRAPSNIRKGIEGFVAGVATGMGASASSAVDPEAMREGLASWGFERLRTSNR